MKRWVRNGLVVGGALGVSLGSCAYGASVGYNLAKAEQDISAAGFDRVGGGITDIGYSNHEILTGDLHVVYLDCPQLEFTATENELGETALRTSIGGQDYNKLNPAEVEQLCAAYPGP